MNIIGIGTDLVQQSRITHLLDKHGRTFAERILSTDELAIFDQIQQKDSYLAKRFAAKEAIAKAFGVGIGEFLALKEISVTNANNGKPIVTFVGKSKEYVDSLSVAEVMISLSDEKEYALAFVVIVR